MSDRGDIKSFNRNWKKTKGENTNWFFRGEPKNQIQYAFGQHWSFLNEVIHIPKKGKCLEVGCGRGSLSAFFADNGYETTLLDLSETVVDEARRIFKRQKLDKNAEFVVGDANNLDFEDNTFDVIASVGLLEHFEDPKKTMLEQVRVLKKGGVYTGYVVPGKWSVQNMFEPINHMLKKMRPIFAPDFKVKRKTPLFRTDYDIAYYSKIMKGLRLKNINSSGVYPYPAISHSPMFPFSVMPAYFEKALVGLFKQLENYRSKNGKHAWACEESLGQGFFVWGTKY